MYTKRTFLVHVSLSCIQKRAFVYMTRCICKRFCRILDLYAESAHDVWHSAYSSERILRHDFAIAKVTRIMIRNWATNPFKPGARRMPPHIAGREREKSVFDDCIRELTRSEEPQAILLVGPRGCGKTVLLNWCKARARSIDGNIRVKEFTREVPTTMAGIARELLDNIFDVRYPDEIVARAKVGIVGAEGKWSTEPTDMMVMDALIEECRKSPLLLILEEAAETSPEGLGALFNLNQRINRETGNMLFALAGTPRVIEAIRESGATFSDRNKVLNIGLLENHESEEAITKPLDENLMRIQEPALARVVEESQGFPYFLQIWGKALFNEAIHRGRQEINMENIESVAAEVKSERSVTYATRYREWSVSDKNILAEVLKSSQDARGTTNFSEDDLLRIVSQVLESKEGSSSRAEEFTRKITDTGCLWQPWGSNRLIPGLPSFVDYVLKQT